MRGKNILETIVDDGDFILDSYTREPLEIVVLHDCEEVVPYGLEMFVDRNNLQIDDFEGRSVTMDEEGSMQTVGKNKVIITE